MKKYKLILFLFLISEIQLSAQNKLSLQQAIEIALQNNYSIGFAKAGADIAKVSNTYGNAGFMPSVALLAGTGGSNYNTKQEFNSGVSVNRKNALTNNLNAGVALNWTLFDGMKMFASKDKLAVLEAQGEVNLKIEMENTITKIIGLYFDAVRQQQLIKAGNEAISIYEERVKIAAKKLEIGSGSKLDLLQAKLDLNAQKSALMKLQMAFENAIISLNQVLSKNADEKYMVEDSISIDETLILSNVKETAAKCNYQLMFAKNNISVADLQLKEAKSTTLPQVGVNLNYNFTQTKNQVGLILLNQNQGLNGGINASLNLYNGYKSQTQIKIAKYTIEQNKFQFSQTASLMDASILKAWKNYQSVLDILKLEEENISIAKENVTVALERFRLGSSNTLELMAAQKSFEDAMSRLVSARYDAKISETDLLRLEGKLVK